MPQRVVRLVNDHAGAKDWHKVRSVCMDEELLAYIVDRLYEADRELETTKFRIGNDPSESDARRSLGRAQKAVSSALKRLDPSYENDVEDEDEPAEDD